MQQRLDVCESCDWFVVQVAVDAPETPEERWVLDPLEQDPAETLEAVRRQFRR